MRHAQRDTRTTTLRGPVVAIDANGRVNLLHLTFNDVELHVQQSGEDVLVEDLGDIDP